MQRLLYSLKDQSVSFDLLIVDSGSTDGSLELALRYCLHVERITTMEFNHGGTRQMMVDKYPGYDIYIYLTQDVELVDSYSIENIISPFADPNIGAVCGRQLPHHNATPAAQHARYFNYPEVSQVKSVDDIPDMGIKAAFMSNSFAAYRSKALSSVGGFPKDVILSEDMYLAARILFTQWKVAYKADAQCRHSHNYSYGEEFRRYFDLGVFHIRESWIQQNFGNVGGEGIRFVKEELKFLGFRKLGLWPSAILRNALKLLAYELGQYERYIPIKLKRLMSMNKPYWDAPP